MNMVQVYVIGDKDTVLGFSLAGAEGEVVTRLEEADKAIDKVLSRREIKLLLITRMWCEQLREKIDTLRMTSLDPIVMEIPGKDVRPPKQSLEEVVRRAIGIRF
jgi:V/A-type H+-transporting ATPase subunit F